MSKKIYKKLRRRLNELPVGFPATPTGVELRILQSIFTPEEAALATLMNDVHETPEDIFARCPDNGTLPELRERLRTMANKGCIFKKTDGDRETYALVPYVVGMYEFQLKRMTPELYKDTLKYFMQGYALEYLAQAHRQMRVIPIGKSLTHRHQVASYDEIKDIVEKAGERIGVVECICRKNQDMIHEECKKTKRREVCFVFRDMYDFCKNEGWARTLDKKEALASLRQCEEEGLVLQPANAREPEFVCACCGCCCGMLGLYKYIPNRAQYVASNYVARVEPDECTACGICEERCQVDAVSIGEEGVALVNPAHCIGCGVCVPTCTAEAIALIKKETPFVPPKDIEELTDILRQNKPGWKGRLKTAVNIVTRR